VTVLYLARHGEAGYATSDDQRFLTAKGIEQSHQVYQHLKQSGQVRGLDLLIHSPFPRARQTASLATEYFSPRQILESEQLIPQGSVDSVNKRLEQYEAEGRHIMLVGHQPLLGNLLAWYTGDNNLAYQVATSSVSCIELLTAARGCGTLKWQHNPL
jgi:phosphohistidine phosphatase